ncbi:hypothetical protein IEQ34_025667 [Dendrobium chrysotoxum]|uniref:Uncharacterized protein n=1 Tax=Dendrobium chrysotoxum TaxID=161865 RepID=A0AAV7FP87_DENCH|nr:hypothetical protein IEQ34_025667 [Dendrobium chrysotoxum]
MKGISCRGNHICFGRYALQALEPAWITARQIFLSTVKERRGAAREIRRFNAGGDFFEMHLTDREDYVEWYASVSTGPILPPHMRIGSNYASRGGQAASRIAELRRYLDTLIRERDTSFSIFFLYGSSIDLI